MGPITEIFRFITASNIFQWNVVEKSNDNKNLIGDRKTLVTNIIQIMEVSLFFPKRV